VPPDLRLARPAKRLSQPCCGVLRQAVPRGLGTPGKNRPKRRCGVLQAGGTLAPRSADIESLPGKLPSSAPKHPSGTPRPPLNSGEHETRQVCVRMHCATAVPCCATYGCVFFVTRLMTAASEGVGGARGISSPLHIYTGTYADHDYAMMIMNSIFWPLYLRLADGCPYERRAVVSEVGVSVFSRDGLEKQWQRLSRTSAFMIAGVRVSPNVEVREAFLSHT